MIKQRLLEAVIDMYGGIEPLVEELEYICEVGDTPAGQYALSRALLRRAIATAKLKHGYDKSPDKFDNDELRRTLSNNNIHMLRASERLSSPSIKATRNELDNSIGDGEYDKYAKDLLSSYKSPMEKASLNTKDMLPYYTRGQGIYKNAYVGKDGRVKTRNITRYEYDEDGNIVTDETGKPVKKTKRISIGRGDRKYNENKAKKLGIRDTLWQIGHYKHGDKSSKTERDSLSSAKESMKDLNLSSPWEELEQNNNKLHGMSVARMNKRKK